MRSGNLRVRRRWKEYWHPGRKSPFLVIIWEPRLSPNHWHTSCVFWFFQVVWGESNLIVFSVTNFSRFLLIRLSRSESREVLSPQDIALRIQNTLSCVSIIIETERKVQINYSVAVNTAGRYTGTFFDPKGFLWLGKMRSWISKGMAFPLPWG